MDTIGKRIKHLRDQKKLSMAELEDAIGASRGSVNQWEKDKSIPGGKLIISLSNYFGVSTDYLLKGERVSYPFTENIQRPFFVAEREETYQNKTNRDSVRDLISKAEELSDEDIEMLKVFAARLTSTNKTPLGENKKRPPFENRGQTIKEKNLPEHYYVKLPLLGQVPAGDPIIAIEQVDEFIDVPVDLLPNSGTYFVLRVRGNSMINANIHDGNLVVVKHQPDAENGEIVVAMTDDDEVTVKTFYREDDHIRLQPENDDLEPIIARKVKILGKVIAVYRRATS